VDARILVGAMMLRDELAKAALDIKEPALHIPQQGKHKICPQCGGDLVEMYQADVYICNDCGIKVTGKLRA